MRITCCSGEELFTMPALGLLTLDSVTVHCSLTSRYKEDFFKKKNHQDNTPFQKENRSCFVSSTFHLLPQIWLAMHPGLTSAPELVLTSAASNQYSRSLFLASGYSSTAAGRWSPFRPKSNCSNSWGMLEGGQESLRAGGWKCGTHLSPETWLKLSPHLGSERDSLNTVLLMSSHGVSVPLSYPLHRL